MEHSTIEPLLTTREVVELTRLSRVTIHRKRRSGDFPQPLLVSSNRIRWRASDIRGWIDELPHYSARGSLCSRHESLGDRT